LHYRAVFHPLLVVWIDGVLLVGGEAVGAGLV